jgi:hypothetical protein
VIGNFRFRYRFRPKFRFRYAFRFRFRYHSIFRFRPKFRFKIEPKTEICLLVRILNWLEKCIFFNLVQMKIYFLIKHLLIKSDVGLSLNIKSSQLCSVLSTTKKFLAFQIRSFTEKEFWFRFRFRFRFRYAPSFGFGFGIGSD